MYNLEKGDIFTSRDVHFYEEVFPFSNNEAFGGERLPSEGEHVVVEDEIEPFRNERSLVGTNGNQHMGTNEEGVHTADKETNSEKQQGTGASDQAAVNTPQRNDNEQYVL
uniref:Uncharacterized protein n=1 Tax=Nelumbo nucifera TaxID=4432 RepID=A0A822Z176_NELNU|nr:TPA_asm: hypothetical protein HUJ06_007387 [Nelumbo nucifera]